MAAFRGPGLVNPRDDCAKAPRLLVPWPRRPVLSKTRPAGLDAPLPLPLPGICCMLPRPLPWRLGPLTDDIAVNVEARV